MDFVKALMLMLSTLVVIKQYHAFDPTRKQSISTVLNAKWASTPFALEISEFLSDVKSDYFWAYLDYLAEDEIVNRISTDKGFYDSLLEFSSRYIVSH